MLAYVKLSGSRPGWNVLDILRCGTFVHLVEGDLMRRRVAALEVDSVSTQPGPGPGLAAGQLVRCSQSRGWKLYMRVSKSDCVWFQVQSLAWCLVFGFGVADCPAMSFVFVC